MESPRGRKLTNELSLEITHWGAQPEKRVSDKGKGPGLFKQKEPSSLLVTSQGEATTSSLNIKNNRDCHFTLVLVPRSPLIAGFSDCSRDCCWSWSWNHNSELD